MRAVIRSSCDHLSGELLIVNRFGRKFFSLSLVARRTRFRQAVIYPVTACLQEVVPKIFGAEKQVVIGRRLALSENLRLC